MKHAYLISFYDGFDDFKSPDIIFEDFDTAYKYLCNLNPKAKPTKMYSNTKEDFILEIYDEDYSEVHLEAICFVEKKK